LNGAQPELAIITIEISTLRVKGCEQKDKRQKKTEVMIHDSLLPINCSLRKKQAKGKDGPTINQVDD
tara:strand:+ start:611 stop:811 length:201 start_codon:yes stop_codon:yes gene_type:complete